MCLRDKSPGSSRITARLEKRGLEIKQSHQARTENQRHLKQQAGYQSTQRHGAGGGSNYLEELDIMAVVLSGQFPDSFLDSPLVPGAGFVCARVNNVALAKDVLMVLEAHAARHAATGVRLSVRGAHGDEVVWTGTRETCRTRKHFQLTQLESILTNYKSPNPKRFF